MSTCSNKWWRERYYKAKRAAQTPTNPVFSKSTANINSTAIWDACTYCWLNEDLPFRRSKSTGNIRTTVTPVWTTLSTTAAPNSCKMQRNVNLPSGNQRGCFLDNSRLAPAAFSHPRLRKSSFFASFEAFTRALSGIWHCVTEKMVPEISKLVTRSLETSGTTCQATKRHFPEEWRNSPADLSPHQEEDRTKKRRAKMCFRL